LAEKPGTGLNLKGSSSTLRVVSFNSNERVAGNLETYGMLMEAEACGADQNSSFEKE
jgi:hypothetical protein